MAFHRIFIRIPQSKIPIKNNAENSILMKTLKHFILISASLLVYKTSAQPDTGNILQFEDYLSIVRQHHPLVYQADLQIQKGNATRLKAKGNFDPRIEGSIDQKNFENKEYYSLMKGRLHIPTWFGVSFEGGFENNRGVFLNPENSNPDNGLWSAGVKIPLGQGLIIDKRRAEWRQAKLYVQSTEQEQKLMLNQLMLDASEAYWKWFKAYNTMITYQEAVENARIRLEGVRQNALVGDRPYIDTLEASIQWQNRKINLAEAELAYNNSTQLLEIYLWQDGLIPLEVNELTRPPLYTAITQLQVNLDILGNLDSLTTKHPEMLQSSFKIEAQKVKQKLYRENLKPKLDIKYNALNEAVGPNDVYDNYSINNYSWGASLSFPIFLRKERGELRLGNAQLQEMQTGLEFKIQQVRYKSQTAFNSWSTSFNQMELFKQNVSNYQQLLAGEQKLFNNGESSLFLINSREKAYISSQQQYIEAISKNQMARIYALYTLAILY